MKDNKPETTSTDSVPFIVYESEMSRLERIIDKLWVLLLIVFAALVISNGIWIYYENQWIDVEISEVEQSSDGDGMNYVVGGDFNGNTPEGNGN